MLVHVPHMTLVCSSYSRKEKAHPALVSRRTMPAMRFYLMALSLLAFLGPSTTQGNAAGFQNPAPQADASAQEDETPAPLRAQMEQGIKHVLVSQVEAWNHGNLEEFMQGYWHSPELEFYSGGTITKGWEPTLERYRKSYKSEGKEMGKLEFQDLKIDPLSLRSAVVTGKFQLTMSDGKTPHGIFTLIFKRMPTGWKIMHDHTSV